MYEASERDLGDLLEDARFDEALTLVDASIEADPDDAWLHVVRAFCLLCAGRHADASAASRDALARDDRLAAGHWIAAEIELAQDEAAGALRHAERAVALDGEDPDYWALLGRARALSGDWAGALEAAEEGLRQDAGNERAQSLRAAAIDQMQDPAEAPPAWDALVANFPASEFARTGRAWALLRGGRVRQARDEFEQAMALGADTEWAREGLLAAMKARNPLYAALLRYTLWMARLPRRTRFLIIIGGVLVFRALRRMLDGQPALEPVLIALVVVWVALVLLTWLGEPLFDLLMMANPQARRLVSADRRRGALLVGGMLSFAGLAAVVSALGAWERGLFVAIALAILALPAAGIFQCERGWPRQALAVYVTLFGAIALGSGVAPDALSGTLFLVAMLGGVLGTWVALYLTNVEVKARPVRARAH